MLQRGAGLGSVSRSIVGALPATDRETFLKSSRSTFAALSTLADSPMLVGIDGTRLKRPKASKPPGRHTVYNITVEGLHTYVAGGFRVHNISAGTYQPVSFGGDLGAALGSQIAGLFAPDDVALSILIGTAGDVVGGYLGDAVSSIFDSDINLGTEFSHFDTRFLNSLFSNAISIGGSELVGFLSDSIGLESGSVADVLFRAAGSYAFEFGVAQLAFEVFGGAAESAVGLLEGFGGIQAVYVDGNPQLGIESFTISDDFIGGLGASIGSALGAYAGSQLAAAIFDGNPVGQSIGSSIGSTVGGLGVTWAANAGIITLSGTVLPIVGAFVGAFAGAFIGGGIGGLFGSEPEPDAFAGVEIDPTTGGFVIGASDADDGGNLELALAMADAAKKALNAFSMSVGGRIGGGPSYSFGHEESDYFYARSYGARTKFGSPEDAINRGVIAQLREAPFYGGDIFVKRAIAASTATTIEDFAEDLSLARQWGDYKDNVQLFHRWFLDGEIIDDPEIASQWFDVVQRAAALGLDTARASDTLATAYANDVLNGKTGVETLVGDLGADLLSGGTGTETLMGGRGDDTYRVRLGEGVKTIFDDFSEVEAFATSTTSVGYRTNHQEGGYDTLLLGAGIVAADLLFELQGDDLVIGIKDPALPGQTFAELANKIVVKSWTEAYNRVEAIELANGEIYELQEDGGVVSLVEAALTVTGTSGTDTLTGGQHADTLIGGSGNDTLIGGAGGDVYRFDFGDGQDLIQDNYGYEESYSSAQATTVETGGGEDPVVTETNYSTENHTRTYAYGAGLDVLEFGSGILPQHVDVVRDGDDLIVYIRDPADLDQALEEVANRVTLQDWFQIDNRVESFRFSNGDEYVVGKEEDPTSESYGLIYRSNDAFQMRTPDALADGQVASPEIVVFDLGGDGIDIVDVDYSSALFDVDVDGYMEASSWFGPTEGVLILDRNNNGLVDDIGELFSATSASGGTHLLAELDTNLDGVIDASDADWDDLRLWLDINQNGQTDLGEWKALHRFGITQIDARPMALSSDSAAVGLTAQGFYGRLDDIHPSLGRFYGAKVSHETMGSRLVEQSESGREWLEIDFEDSTVQNIQLGSGGTGQSVNASVNRVITGSDEDDSYVIEDTVAPASGTDLGFRGAMVNSGSGSDTVIGGSGNDVLIGGSGSDTLYGGSGDDIVTIDDDDDLAKIAGGTGFDALILEGDNALTLDIASLGFEALVSGAGHDTVWTSQTGEDGILVDGGSGHDTLIGSEGGDRLDGGSGHDTVIGGADDDWLRGGQGTDTVFGGSGDDLIYFETASELSLVYGGSGFDTALYEGTTALTVALAALGIEGIVAGAAADTLDATGAVDARLLGAGGNDTLVAGTGTDRLDGGAGSDWVVFADVTGGLTVDLTDGSTGHGDTLFSVENVQGTSAADTLIGNGAANVLEGLGGGDSLYGGSGVDAVSYQRAGAGVAASLASQNGTGGAAAGDSYESIEALIGSSFADTLVGSSAGSSLYGGGGDDSLIGSAAVDYFYGGADGRDWVDYSAGPNPNGPITIDLSTGMAAGGDAEGDVFDSIEAVRAGAGDDTLLGASSDDALAGASGTDTLVGHSGDDLLAGSSGSDSLRGGDGDDTYQFGVGDGVDTIQEGDYQTETVISYSVVETWHATGGEGEGYYTYDYVPQTGTDTFYHGDGTDTLQLLSLTAGEIVVEIVGDDLVVAVRDPGDPDAPISSLPDRVIIKNWTETEARVEWLAFEDGTSLDISRLSGTGRVTMLDGGNNIHLGTSGQDLVAGFDGNDAIAGFHGNDILVGGAGDDTLFGDSPWSHAVSGNDRLEGGSGTDTLYGGRGDDTYVFGLGYGVETVIDDAGGSTDGGSDTLEFLEGIDPADLLIARVGDDMVIGVKNPLAPNTAVTALADRIIIKNWAQSQDRIETLRFADGTDFSLYSFTAGVNGGLGGSGSDTFIGTDQVDEIWAAKGDDTVYGGSGADLLRGEGGNDVLVGGAGGDSFDGGTGIDTVSYEGSTGVHARLNNGDVGGGDAVGDVFANIENLWGSSFGDTLTGAGDANELRGQDGADSLFGHGGDDLLHGGSGDDMLRGGNGNDGYVLQLGGGVDNVFEYGGIDYIQLEAGVELQDLLVERSGDYLGVGIVDPGNPEASIWSLSDKIDIWGGAAGNPIEQIRAADGSIVLLPVVAEGYRGAVGGHQADTLEGSSALEEVHANAGNDTVFGYSGGDRLFGSEGDDTLVGGSGADSLVGGNGDDTYVFSRGDGADTIIEISGTDRIVFGSGIEATDVVIEYSGNDLVVAIKDPEDLDADPSTLPDRLTIQDWATPSSRIGTLVFASGAVVALPDPPAGLQAHAGTDSADTLIASEAEDWIEGRDGDDTLDGAGATDRIFGGTGNDSLSGGGGDNSLYGGSGRDVLSGHSGNDVFDGGSGVDAVSYDDANTAIYVNLKTGDKSGTHAAGDTYVSIEGVIGSDYADTLWGRGADDWLSGGSGSDTLSGRSGVDTLVGGSGADTLHGNKGDDVYRFERGFGADKMEDGSWETTQTIVPTTYVEWIDPPGEEPPYQVTTIVNTTVVDTIYTGGGTDVLEFADGIVASEIVYERIGSTLYVGLKDPANPDLSASQLSDRIEILNWTDSESRIEQVRLADGTVIDLPADLATGLQHHLGSVVNDTIVGGALTDRMAGASGFDSFYGGSGADTFEGGSGNDYFVGGAGGDTLIGGQGQDTASYEDSGAAVTVSLSEMAATPSGGNAAGDVLAGIENVAGSAYADTLSGDTGDNVLVGNEGDDVLAGGEGSDSLVGGEGSDSYTFAIGDGHDHVVEAGTGSDKLTLVGVATASDIWLQRHGDDLIVSILGTTDKVVVDDWFAVEDGTLDWIALDSGGTLLGTAVQDLVGLMAMYDAEGGDPADYYDGNVPSEVASAVLDTWYWQPTTLTGGSGADSLAGGLGSDTLYGGSGADSLFGNENDDRLEGGSGADSLYGGHGDDLMIGGPGGDSMVGGSGIDTVSYEGSDAVTIRLYNGTATGGHAEGDSFFGVEQIVGSDFNDDLHGDENGNTFFGGSGADVMNVFGGDDVLDGGSGDGDGLWGGDGDDAFVLGMGRGADNAADSSGSDEIWLDSGVTPEMLVIERYSAEADNLYVAIEDSQNPGLTATSYADRLRFLDGAVAGGEIERLRFADGSVFDLPLVEVGYRGKIGTNEVDTMVGTSGQDELHAFDGNDTVIGLSGSDRLFGGDGDDSLYGGSGGDSIIGATGIDSLYGGSGADVQYGGVGNDSLSGGAGNDYLDGGDGDDSLSGGADHDGLYGGSGSDSLSGGGGYDYLDGGSGYDYLDGGEGNDSLIGEAGNDGLYGGSGADEFVGGADADGLYGGSGNDTASYLGSAAAVAVLLTAGSASGVGGDAQGDTLSEIENLSGSSFADTLGGDVNANRLAGDQGDDSLYGGSGADELIGGAGADVVNGGSGSDTASYVGSAAGVTVVLSAGAATGSGGDAEGDLLTDIEDLGGSGYADTLVGDTGVNVISGYQGNDSLYGEDGSDTLAGGEGGDLLEGGSGTDYLYGDAGADTLRGGLSADLLQGAAGDDLLEGNEDSDSLYGGEGQDDLYGGSGGDSLFGDAGADVLHGDGDADSLYGGDGNDSLYGGSASDIMAGGSGNDLLEGGQGGDTYAFAAGDGIDTIVESAGSDELLISGISGAEDLWFQQQGDDLVMSLMGTDDKVIVDDWFSGGSNQVERIELSNGQYLLNSSVQQLVDAMAQFDGGGSDPADVYYNNVPSQVVTVIGQTWQS